MRTFVGERASDGSCRVYIEDERGAAQRVRLKHRTDRASHSPSGFEWGYAGSGPAELARALCAVVMERDEVDPRVYQRFKARVVQHLPHTRWRLTEGTIRDHLSVIADQLAQLSKPH